MTGYHSLFTTSTVYFNLFHGLFSSLPTYRLDQDRVMAFTPQTLPACQPRAELLEVNFIPQHRLKLVSLCKHDQLIIDRLCLGEAQSCRSKVLRGLSKFLFCLGQQFFLEAVCAETRDPALIWQRPRE